MTDYSERDRQRLRKSMLFTAGLWFAFGMGIAFMPLLPRTLPPPQLPSVRITLNRPETAEMPLASAIPEKTATRPDLPAKSAGKTAATKDASAKTAPSTGKPKTAAAKSAPAGLGIPNFSSPVTSSRDASGTPEQLEFTGTAETARPRSVNSGVSVPELEGSAALIRKPDGSEAVVAATGGANRSPAASAETAGALGTIAKQAQSGSASGGMTAPGNAANAADGKPKNTVSVTSSLDLGDLARRLRFPDEPAVTLPPELAKQVDTDKIVTIEFTVRPDGSVPRGTVSFNPSGLLSAAIQDYLRDQFSRWRFEPGAQDGHAQFRYSIKVK